MSQEPDRSRKTGDRYADRIRGPVGRPVVYDDDLAGESVLPPRLGQRLEEGSDVLDLVVGRNDDGEVSAGTRRIHRTAHGSVENEGRPNARGGVLSWQPHLARTVFVRIASVASAAASHVNVRARSIARASMRLRSAGFLAAARSASARAATSPCGTTWPVSPSTTVSRRPGASLTIAIVPTLCASIDENPQPSFGLV